MANESGNKERFFLWLIILSSTAKVILLVDSSEIVPTKFIDNFFIKENKPVMVISFFCGNIDLIKHLHRTFSSLGIQFMNIDVEQHIPHHLDQEHTTFLVDLQCIHSYKIIQEANSRQLFRLPYQWIILENTFNLWKSCNKSPPILSRNTRFFNIEADINRKTLGNEYFDCFIASIKGNPEFTPRPTYDNADEEVYEDVTKNSRGVWEITESPSRLKISNQGTLTKTEKNFIGLENDYGVASLFQNISILVDSEVIIAIINSIEDYDLYAIYKLPSSNKLIVENYGYWTLLSGYVDERTQPSALRRRDLRLIPITATFVINDNDTLNHLTDFRNQHIDSVTKSNYHLVTHLIEFVNGSQKYSFVDSWVGNRKTGSGGMVGEMVAGRADIGGTPLFMLASRLSTVEYIAMTTPTRGAFVFRQPPLSHGANIFALPFHWQVWTATFALFILGALLLYATAWWEKIQTRNQVDQTQLRAIPGEVIVATLGALCQQGSPKEPKLLSGRQVFFAMLMSLMFLYTAYSANIVSLLQSSSDSIRTLEDLLKSGIKLAVDDTVYNRHYFPAETEPTRRAIWDQRVAVKGTEPNFMNIDKGVALMRRGLFGFHMEMGVGYKIVGDTFREEEKCDLQEVTFLRVSDPWFAIAKHLPYREIVKIGTRRAQEAGLCTRSRLRVYAIRPRCSGPRATFAGAALRDCAPAMRALAAGHGLALGVLLAECAVRWLNIRRI